MSSTYASPIAVLVLGGNHAERARTENALRAQSVAVHILANGDALAATDASVAVLVQAGVELEYTACERLAWLLTSSPQFGWATGGSLEAPVVQDLADAILALCAFRTADGIRVLGDGRWFEAAHDGRRTPGLGLQLAVAMHRDGWRGACVGQPPVTRHEPASEWAYLSQQGHQTLALLGIDLIAATHSYADGPSTYPLQRLDSTMWPTLTRPRHPVARGGFRILMLVQGYPMGGYAAFNADLVPRLVARGHQVTTVSTEWWLANWRLAQVRRVAPDIHHVQSSSALAAIPAYIAHLISSRDIDVVFVSHSFLAYRMLPLLRAAFPHVAFVDYVHTEWFEDRMYGSYATMSARYSAHLDGHVASSQALADSLVQQGAVAAHTHVAHIGIDTAVWQAAGVDRDGVRAAFGASPDTTVLLFAGRVSPEKRPLLAVEALEALRAEGRDVQLVVAGDGPMLQALNEEVERRGLTAFVALLGEVDEDTLRQVYAASDIYFAPSEIEGIARTLYEAMALGCVPVVSDVGGQRELVAVDCGSLVPPGRHDATPYLPALRHWCDRAARAVASNAARRRIVEAYDSARTVSAIEHVMHVATETVSAQLAQRVDVANSDDAALAEDVAVMGLEIMRRHALAAS